MYDEMFWNINFFALCVYEEWSVTMKFVPVVILNVWYSKSMNSVFLNWSSQHVSYVFVVQYHHIQKWNTKIYNLMKMIYFYSLFLLNKNVNTLCHHASDYTNDVRILKSMGKE